MEQTNCQFNFPGSPLKELTIPFIKKIKHVFINVDALIKAGQSKGFQGNYINLFP